MKQVSHLVVRVLTNPGVKGVEEEVAHQVAELCSRFPLPLPLSTSSLQ